MTIRHSFGEHIIFEFVMGSDKKRTPQRAFNEKVFGRCYSGFSSGRLMSIGQSLSRTVTTAYWTWSSISVWIVGPS